MWATTPDETRNQSIILVITTLLLILCFVLFGLRTLSRKTQKAGLWVDDWFMVAALVMCIFMATCNYVAIYYGSGVHRKSLPNEIYTQFQTLLYVYMLSWAVSVAIVKMAILAFYWRVFSVAGFRRTVLIVGIVLLANSLATVLAFAFQCTPVRLFWDPNSTEGFCILQIPFYLANGSLNILGDVVVLALPIPHVWNLKASRSQRLALVFLFTLGGFVCITSIFRLIAITQIDPLDFSYSNVAGGLWSLAEVLVGFICANLPHTRPLFIRWFRVNTRQASTLYGDKGDAFNSRTQLGIDRSPAGFQQVESKTRIQGGRQPQPIELETFPLEECSTTLQDALKNACSAPLWDIEGRAIAVRTDMSVQTQNLSTQAQGRKLSEPLPLLGSQLAL